MKKERNHVRRTTTDYYLVYNHDSGTLLGRVGNISMGGMMVITMDPPKIGHPLNLRIVLPRKVGGRDSITLAAEACWKKFIEHADWWETGFQFRHIVPEDIEVLQQVMHELMARQSGDVNSSDLQAKKKITTKKIQYLKS